MKLEFNNGISMQTIHNKLICLVLFFISFHSPDSEDIKSKPYKERILLENFESLTLTSKSIQVSANTIYLPDVRMSKNFTSPDLISERSLLIRIPDLGAGIPFDILFPIPYIVDDHIIEFEFYIYSNQISGELYIYVSDSKFQKHKIKVANLNFEGWRCFKIAIGNHIMQKDFIIGKSAPVKLVGFQINPTRDNLMGKENIIAIDDIYIVKRKRYKLPQMDITELH